MSSSARRLPASRAGSSFVAGAGRRLARPAHLGVPPDASAGQRLADAPRMLDLAFDACRKAAEVLAERFLASDPGEHLRADGSLVCTADRRAEESIRDTLRAATPDLGLRGQEFGSEGHPRDRWVIDPLDGTHAFLRGLPGFATLIALELDGQPVLGVVHAPLQGAPRRDGPGSRGRVQRRAGGTWWAVRGEGAFAAAGLADWPDRPRRIAVNRSASLREARVCHGDLAALRRLGLWRAFEGLVDEAGRMVGCGDWWGHVQVAEGLADAMIDPVVGWHDVAALVPLVVEAGGELHLSAARSDAACSRTAVSGGPRLSDVIARRLGTDGLRFADPVASWRPRRSLPRRAARAG